MSATRFVTNSGGGRCLPCCCEVEDEGEEIGRWCWAWRRAASFCGRLVRALKLDGVRTPAVADCLEDSRRWWDASRSQYVTFKRLCAAGAACG